MNVLRTKPPSQRRHCARIRQLLGYLWRYTILRGLPIPSIQLDCHLLFRAAYEERLFLPADEHDGSGRGIESASCGLVSKLTVPVRQP